VRQVLRNAGDDGRRQPRHRHQQAAAAIVAQQPYVAAFMSAMGSSGAVNSTPNLGRIFMRLKPRKERPSIDRIMIDLRQKLSVIPGLKAYPQVPPAIRIGGSGVSRTNWSAVGVVISRMRLSM